MGKASGPQRPVKLICCLTNGGYEGKTFYSSYLSGNYTILGLGYDNGSHVANIEIQTARGPIKQSLGLVMLLNDRTI